MPDTVVGEAAASAPQNAKRFAAFISYSHRDEEFGDWLHKRLENYQVPSALVGGASSVGPIGKRLGKVFRDRADLSAAHDLAGEIREGLEQSDALIVLCSPRSCGSKYVNEEIRTFKALGKGHRIFAAIVDGEPHAAGRPGYTAADECFPPSLIYSLAGDGTVSSDLEQNEPIAADFRDGKDGRENGSLKIIAGLIEVGLDELIQREKQAERRRRLRANLLAAAMAALAIAAVGGAFGVARLLSGMGARASITLAEQARAASDQGFYDRAARYARMGVAGADLPVIGFDARAAEIELRRANGASQAVALLTGHEDAVLRAAFSEDGSRLISASEDGTARLWDLASGAVLRVFGGGVYMADISPDGRRVITASASDHTVRMWDAGDGAELHRIASGGDPIAMARWNSGCTIIMTITRAGIVTFWNAETATPIRRLSGVHHPSDAAVSDDGSRAVIADAFGADVWEVTSGRSLANLGGHTGAILTVEFSRDGSRVVTASEDNSARVVDVNSDRTLAVLRGHTDRVIGARFDAAGERVVTVSSDRSVRVSRIANGAAMALPLQDNYLPTPSFSPDGRRLVTTSADGTVRIWNAETAAELQVLHGHQGAAANPLFSPDGARLATVSQDRTIRIWNTQPAAPILLSGHDDAVTSVAFAAAGARILTASDDGTMRLWDAQSGRAISTIGGPDEATLAYFSPDGSRFARVMEFGSDSNQVSIWDAQTLRRISTVAHDEYAEIYSAAFSPDGARLVTASDDNTARIWNADTGAEIARLSHDGEVYDALFGPGGAVVLTIDDDGRVRTWGSNHQRALEFGEHVRVAAFSSDGSIIATGASDGSATIWDARTGRAIASTQTHHDQPVTHITLSRDAKRLVTSSYDGTARVFDAGDGRELFLLRGHQRGVLSAVFSADETLILTASEDGAARVWDSATGRELAVLRGHAGRVLGAAFSPDGSTVVTVSADSTARIWPLPPALFAPRSELLRRTCELTLARGLSRFSRLELQQAPILDPNVDGDACARDRLWTRMRAGFGWR